MAVDIAGQIELWRGKLLDTSKRNRLINFNTARAGGIRISHPDVDAIWATLFAGDRKMTFVRKGDLLDRPDVRDTPDGEEGFERDSVDYDLETCLASPRLQPDHILSDLTDKQLAARLRRLDLNARTAMTETGVPTLFLAIGLLGWYESKDSNAELQAPLLLIPARLGRESVESPWTLALEDDEVASNFSLIQMLSDGFGIQMPPAPDDLELDDPRCRDHYYAQVRHAVRDCGRWNVLDTAALGIFSFQKIAMWKDLGKNKGKIASHDLCRAVAGDTTVRIATPVDIPSARELDTTTRPTDTFHILDSDSSQHEAILAATRGASLIIDGPPGTGKSQTIANIIAESLAAGRSVLFVSEKSAALEVVKRRLDERGLGDFCLECHSHKANKKVVVDELGRCIGLGRELYASHEGDLERLYAQRTSLNSYVRSLHLVRAPLGLSAFQVHGRLAQLRESKSTRCAVPDVLQVTSDRLRRMTDLLVALADCRNVIEDFRAFPWRGCRAAVYSHNLRADVQHHFATLASSLSSAATATSLLARLGFTPENPTISEWDRGLDEARETLGFPVVPTSWFESNPRRTARGYADLGEATLAYRKLLADLPEFSPQALWRIDPANLDAIRGTAVAPMNHACRASEPTIRGRHERFGVIRQELATLDQLIAEVLTAAEPVAALLSGAARAMSGHAELTRRDAAVALAALESLVISYRQTRAALPEFDETRVEECGTIGPNDLPGYAPMTVSLAPHSRETLNGYRVHIVRILERVATLRRHVSVVADRHAEIGSRLGLPERPVVARGLGRVADLLALAAQLGRVPRGMFDPAQREELRKVSERALADAADAAQLRLRLLDRFRPAALDASSATLAAAVARFGTWWSRLGPKWWAFKTQALALYAHGAPRTEELLADLRELHGYHRRAELARQVSDAYGRNLIARDDGPDWERSLDAMAQIQRLDPLLKVYPELKELLVSGVLPDADELPSLAAEMSAHARAVQNVYGELARDLDLSAFGPTREPDRRSLAEFDQWLGTLKSELGAEANRADAVSVLLSPGGDVSLADLPDRAKAIDRLARLRGNLSRYAAILGITTTVERAGTSADASAPPPGTPSLARVVSQQDWSAVSECCAWVVGLIEGQPDGGSTPIAWELASDRTEIPIPDALIAAVGRLRDRHTAFYAAYRICSDLADVEVLPALTPNGTLRVRAGEAQRLLRDRSDSLRDALANSDRIVSLLADGRDLALTALAQRSQAIERLVSLRRRIEARAAELDLSPEEGRIAESDWGELATLGTWLLNLLDRYPGGFPERLIQAASSHEYRSALAEAVRRNEQPRTPDLEQARTFLAEFFDSERDVSTGIVISQAGLTALAEWTAARARDVDLLQDWVRLREVVADLQREGLKQLLSELIEGQFGVDEACDAFLARFYQSWLDAIHERDDSLRRFNADGHERIVEEFRKLDRDSIRLAHTRIRERLLNSSERPDPDAGDAPGSSEMGILLREIHKRSRHLPLRLLFARVPTLLLRIKPCLMMSPLAVSTYLDSEAIRFDLVS